MSAEQPILTAQNLTRRYGGGILSRAPAVTAVDGVSLAVRAGQTLAIVGESGSGKSTVARMLVGLERPDLGSVTIDGRDMAALGHHARRQLGRTIQYVFQDPIASLNPRHSVARILDGTLRRLAGVAPAAARRDAMEALLALVGLPGDSLERYPHEFSGGQAQRIAIARALAAQARILVLDEPVSALDVSVQAQVLLLLDRLRTQLGLTYVFISHDLAVVEAVADTVLVMQAGRVVEEGPAAALFARPKTGYTRQLLDSAPRMEPGGGWLAPPARHA